MADEKARKKGIRTNNQKIGLPQECLRLALEIRESLHKIELTEQYEGNGRQIEPSGELQ